MLQQQIVRVSVSEALSSALFLIYILLQSFRRSLDACAESSWARRGVEHELAAPILVGRQRRLTACTTASVRGPQVPDCGDMIGRNGQARHHSADHGASHAFKPVEQDLLDCIAHAATKCDDVRLG